MRRILKTEFIRKNRDIDVPLEVNISKNLGKPIQKPNLTMTKLGYDPCQKRSIDDNLSVTYLGNK